jgi:hypothetical protein
VIVEMMVLVQGHQGHPLPFVLMEQMGRLDQQLHQSEGLCLENATALLAVKRLEI